mmetsp:Transcript_20579/g.59600  ORF Transcript_20579/g.59600 Transcript_20579/m.59600 type:complete len:315 (-) Transcript_20579:30-974(-)
MGGYEHKYFIRGSPDLCELIVRRKDTKSSSGSLKSNKSSSSSHSVMAMPLNSMPFPTMNAPVTVEALKPIDKMNMFDSQIKSFQDYFLQPAEEPQSLSKSVGPIDDVLFDLEPSSMPRPSSFKKSMSFGRFQNSSIGRLDDLLGSEDMQAIDGFISVFDDIQPTGGATDALDDLLKEDLAQDLPITPTMPESEKDKLDNDDTLSTDHSFPFKLHLMLDTAEKDGYSHVVSWVKGGTAFQVHNHDLFVKHVMPNYFDQSKYESFRRQLNLYQFNRVSKGVDRGVISHPCLLKGSRHLCKDIVRRKPQTLLSSAVF